MVSGRYSKKILSVLLILNWIDDFLAVPREMLLNLWKHFENQLDGPWPAFKSGGHCAACFSKENYLIGKIFGRFENRQLALAGFQKLAAQLWEICYSIGAKNLNSPVLKNLSPIQ